MTISSPTTGNAMPADFLAAVNPKKESASMIDTAENRFLKLLTAQLKNQDPLNPLDNAQMTSQMAQISTVNGIEKLNATLEKLMTNSTDSQAMQAAQMLGRNVLVSGSALVIQGEMPTLGGFDVSRPVDAATVTIRDANGLLVRTLELGALPAGLKDFLWDGKNDAGEPVAAGRYTYSVSAQADGKSVSAQAYQLAVVSGVLREKSGVQLELGQGERVGLADVRLIF